MKFVVFELWIVGKLMVFRDFVFLWVEELVFVVMIVGGIVV